MIKQHIQQALYSLRENKLVGAVSIAGTALSIAVVMVVVALFQIKLLGYSPESERSRMLYVFGVRSTSTAHGQNNTGISVHVLKECFYSLQTPETVTAFTYRESRPISLPQKQLFEEYTIKYTDTNFWNVFDFTFIEGRPYTEAEFNSSLQLAVISEYLAERLFGKENVIGKEILINHLNYTIRGVVKTPSQSASEAFSHIWLPYSTNSHLLTGQYENICGSFSAVLLARSTSDFEAIGNELQRRIDNFNTGQKEYLLSLITEKPLTRLQVAIGNSYFRNNSILKYLLETGILLLFLLLIPAFNLINIVQSSMQKRREELGIRRAFGASRLKLISQVLAENMVITLIGSTLGILLSVLFLYAGQKVLQGTENGIDGSMLLKPEYFLAALLFAALLNLLSAAIPAWQGSRRSIVDSIK